MRAVFEHYDSSRPGYILPPGTSPQYYENENADFRRSFSYDMHMWNIFADESPEKFAQHVHPLLEIPLVHISEIQEDEEYVYVIMLYNVLYFVENKSTGFKHISDRVKNDINQNKCRLFVCMPFEGTSGAVGSATEDDFLTLQEWCTQAELNTDNVFYINPNVISDKESLKYNITYNCLPCMSQELWTWGNTAKSGITRIPEFKPDASRNLYLSYNRRPRSHRVYFLAELKKRNLFARGINSFNPFGADINLQVSRLTHLYGSEYTDIFTELYTGGEIIADVPTADITNSVGKLENYNNTFCSVVTETLVEAGTLFFSEKTWRCISVGHPFMLLSNPGALAYLRSIGFKTFGDFWDESYDHIDNHVERIDIIVSNLEKLSKLTVDELYRMREQIYPILSYNKQHFNNRVHERFYRSNNGVRTMHVFTPIEELILRFAGGNTHG